MDAVLAQDLKEANQLLEKGASANYMDEHNISLMDLTFGNEELMELLTSYSEAYKISHLPPRSSVGLLNNTPVQESVCLIDWAAEWSDEGQAKLDEQSSNPLETSGKSDEENAEVNFDLFVNVDSKKLPNFSQIYVIMSRVTSVFEVERGVSRKQLWNFILRNMISNKSSKL